VDKEGEKDKNKKNYMRKTEKYEEREVIDDNRRKQRKYHLQYVKHLFLYKKNRRIRYKLLCRLISRNILVGKLISHECICQAKKIHMFPASATTNRMQHSYESLVKNGSKGTTEK
jgi:hypothetical protein